MTYNTLRTSGESDDFFHIRTMTTPEPDNTTYKVLRLTTEGWTDFDSQTAVNLTKEQCNQVLKNLTQLEGIDFRELKAVRDN